MTYSFRRLVAVGLLLVSLTLLIPGLIAPVLTIRGVLTRDGIARVAPMLLERGITDDTIGVLKAMMDPTIVAMIQARGMDLRKMVIDKVSPQLTAALQKSATDVPVYEQTRSILGSVRRLYEVGSPVPATLILLFSVIVPFGKMLLVAWALTLRDARVRDRTLTFVEAIARWSMADVFVVALFIAFLAAQASQSANPQAEPPLIAFTAHFGTGFYWFAAYCVVSLASQQVTVRMLREAPVEPRST
jgi:hypothetical protein